MFGEPNYGGSWLSTAPIDDCAPEPAGSLTSRRTDACSRQSFLAGESIVARAGRTRLWVLIEHPGPWPHSAPEGVLPSTLVDRIGAARVLVAGLACLGFGALLAALAPTYLALLPAAVLMGLGNSVFHPADYAILGHHVAAGRMARAFSVHTVGGTIGWAIAPVLVAGIAAVSSWRVALLASCVIGLALAYGLRDDGSRVLSSWWLTRRADDIQLSVETDATTRAWHVWDEWLDHAFAQAVDAWMTLPDPGPAGPVRID